MNLHKKLPRDEEKTSRAGKHGRKNERWEKSEDKICYQVSNVWHGSLVQQNINRQEVIISATTTGAIHFLFEKHTSNKIKRIWQNTSYEEWKEQKDSLSDASSPFVADQPPFQLPSPSSSSSFLFRWNVFSHVTLLLCFSSSFFFSSLSFWQDFFRWKKE